MFSWLRHLLKGSTGHVAVEEGVSAPPQPDDLPEDEKSAILGNVEYATKIFSDLVGHPLPPGREGVKFLEGYIEQTRESYLDAADDSWEELAEVCGCYLGACIIETYGGRWVRRSDDFAIEVAPGVFVFPIAKASKQILNGLDEDSVLFLFNSIPAIVQNMLASEASHRN